MVDNALIFLYAGYLFSIFVLAVAGILNPIFVIRLQIQQAKVKNGLAILRRQMLGIGIVAEIVIVVALFCLTGRFFIHDPAILRYTITVAIMFFSFFVLAIIVIFIQVYNQNYSARNKELHELIDRLEKDEELVKKIDKAIKK